MAVPIFPTEAKALLELFCQ